MNSTYIVNQLAIAVNLVDCAGRGVPVKMVVERGALALI